MSAGSADPNVLSAVRVVHWRFQFRLRLSLHGRRVLRAVRVEFVLRLDHVGRRPVRHVRANVAGQIRVSEHDFREQ